MTESMIDTCKWVGALLANMDVVARGMVDDFEIRAGSLDALSYLSVQFVATKTAYEMADGGKVVGRGYNLLSRLAIGAQAAQSLGAVLGMNQRIGASYQGGMDAVFTRYRNVLEDRMMELV